MRKDSQEKPTRATHRYARVRQRAQPLGRPLLTCRASGNALVREQRSGTTAYDTTYTYDPLGNRILKTNSGVLTTYAYDTANQLKTAQDTGGVTTFAFDAAGNQTLEQSPANVRTTFTWDTENRLTSWQQTGTTVNMEYNGDGQRMRLSRPGGGGNFRWVWDGQNVLMETSDGGSTVEVDTLEPLVYGNLVSRRRLSGGNWFPRYALWDGIGSLDRETGATETQEINKYVYNAFGQIVSEANVNVPTNWRYVGRQGYYTDRVTTALPLHVRARPYEPRIGRWVKRDPIGFAAGDGNFYRYVGNTPVVVVDPSGMVPLAKGANIDAICKLRSG